MKTLAGATVLLFAAVSLFGSPKQEDKPKPPADQSMMMMVGDTESMGMVPPFKNFTDLKSAQTAAMDKPTVLFFYATWCPTCQAAKKDLQANADALKGINLLIVDYDNSDDLKKKYGVTYQHTFVSIDSAGVALATWNGGGSKELLDRTMAKGTM